METKTFWIIAIIAIVAIGLTFLLIGVLGKHYNYNRDKKECEYNFFTLDGMTKKDCEAHVDDKIKEEAAPGSTVKFSVEMENNFTSAEDLDIEEITIEALTNHCICITGQNYC